MATTRRNTAQPFKKGTGRTPSPSLKAALRGAPLMGSNPAQPGRDLQKSARPPVGNVAGGVVTGRAIQQAGRQRTAKKLTEALQGRVGGSVAMPRKNTAPNPLKGGVADPEGGRQVVNDVPANQSGTQEGSTKPKVKLSAELAAKTYTNTGELNQTGNERSGQSFTEFTVKGRPGKEYHEYIDPVTKKRRVVAFTRKKGPAKGVAATTYGS